MSKRREYAVNPYGMYGLSVKRWTPITPADMKQYTLYKKDGAFHLVFGEWVRPVGAVVFAHGKLTPRELDYYKKRKYIYVYHHSSTHTINIYSYFQAYTQDWLSMATEEQRIARMYPVSDIEWISRKVEN